MGSAVAFRLLSQGHDLAILPGPSRRNVERLVAAGVSLARNANELADCAVVLTCLPSSDVVASVAEQILAASVRPGFAHIDLTSGDPRITVQLSKAYADRGALFVDVAVSGTPEQALAGELTLLVGSDGSGAANLEPLLRSLSKRVVTMGAPGSAHRAKLIMSALGMSIAVASAEALAAAQVSGMDLAAFSDLIAETSINSGTFQAMAAAAIDGDEARRKLSIENAAKDVRTMTSLLADLGMTARVGTATAATLRAATDAGHGPSYVTALTRLALSDVRPPVRSGVG